MSDIGEMCPVKCDICEFLCLKPKDFKIIMTITGVNAGIWLPNQNNVFLCFPKLYSCFFFV